MNKFLKGAAILTFSGIIIKILGMFFRIPLTLWVGADGLSYYSSVYSIYTLVLTISTAGFPTAVSRIVSERVAVKNYKGANKVLRVAKWILMCFGIIGFCFLYFGADFIAVSLLKNDGAQSSLKCIAPALLFVPVMAVQRGYFQGRQNMVPTAISQSVEQLFRVGVGLLLAYQMIPRGNTYVSAAATLGCSAGAFAGFVITTLMYQKHKTILRHEIFTNRESAKEEKTWDLVKEILAISIPITIGACILPLLNSIDSMMIMRRLQATGWTIVESRALYGRLGGYCTSIINLPTVFVSAITLGIVPLLASNYKLENYDLVKRYTAFMNKLGTLVGAPCAIGICVLAEPILKLLYPTAKVAQEVMDAVPTLRIFSAVVLLTALTNTLAAILQSVGKQTIPVRNFLIGACFKVIASYVLVGIKPINVNGGPLSSIIAYVIVIVLDYFAINKYIGAGLKIRKVFLMPLLSSVIMGYVAFFSYKGLFYITARNSISVLGAIMISVVIYLITILATNCITREELLTLPKGQKLVKILDKFTR